MKKAEVQGVRKIRRLVVVRVAEVGGVGQHDGAIVVVPVGLVIAAQSLLEESPQSIGARLALK